jgi:hypothetical protein
MAERIYRGRVNRVVTPNLLEVDIDLGLGVHITRRIVLNNYTVGDAEKAMHCLVILVGGKSVLVRVDDETIDGHVRGTVFTTETWNIGDAEIPTESIDNVVVRDTVAWMGWSGRNGHNPRVMRTAMKG